MHFFKTATPVALAGAVSLWVAPAMADVTAPELWLEWQEMSRQTGQTLSVASQSYAAGVMTLSGVSSVLAMPEGQLTVLVPQLTLTDQSDGTVSVGLSDDIAIELDMGSSDDGRMSMTMAHDGLVLIASGTPEQRGYIYAADELSVVVDEIREGSEVLPVDVSVILNNFATDYILSGFGTDAARISSTGTVSALEVTAMAEDDGQSLFDLSYQLRDITAESAGPLAAWTNYSDPGAAFRSDQATTARVTHQGGGYSMLADDGSEPMEISGSSVGGGFTVAIANGAVSYGVTSDGLKMLLRTPDVSFPVEFSADKMGLTAQIPMAASDTPVDFGFGVNLTALTLSDGIWSIFDELGTLPRDPATVILDLSGKARLFMDLFDPDMGSSDVPGEVTEFSIDALQIKAAGADLTGSGAFTVDNMSQGVIPNAPKLVGSAELALAGANALIDNLIRIGLVQPEEAMGVRMMMGMFARPGDAPDSLVSKIELTESGGLVANGMTLQ